jgi:ATP-dependent RNA helicase DDX10/DBP4
MSARSSLSHRPKRPKRSLQPSAPLATSSSSSKVVDRKLDREQEIATLTQRIQDEAPPATSRGGGSSSLAAATASQRPSFSATAVTAFASLPLSKATQRGLLEASFTTTTAIQAACLPHALAGRDVLGAAQTGSGKTLAFVIPMLEALFRQQCTPNDGPGAIVLSPTRELALQIFQVIQTVGRHHVVSVGLLIGGKKDFFLEQQNIRTTNIIVATPGRLLQHLEQTAHLDISDLQMLVLDEADRVLDLGFRNQLIRVLEYLPQQNEQSRRQTMLFSATQTRDVQSLAALSLQSPEYIGVHDAEKTETPDLLQQSYVVVPVEHKLNAIFSFVKSHLHCKCIVFLSTCAQVRHAHDVLCHLRPGVPVMALHGKLSQERRTQIYFDLIQRSGGAVLLATDLAARGLDFPKIDWVVQADAPEDAAMYIHRAGRTARYRSVGKSLLMVTPGEEKRGFIDLIVRGGGAAAASGGTNASGKANSAQKVPLKKLSINPAKATIVTDRAASLVASNAPLNILAKKAFQSYIRSITLMPHKHIFDVQDLDLDGYAKSLGLAATPNLRFLETAAADRTEFRDKKNVNKKLQRLKEQIKMEKLQKKIERLGGKLPEPDQTAHSTSIDNESDDDLLVPKSHHSADEPSADATEDLPLVNVNQVTQSRKLKKIRVDGRIGSASQHTVFDEEGAPVKAVLETIPTSVPRDTLAVEEARSSYLEAVRARLGSTKEQDVADQKDRIRLKHKKRRLAEKGDLEDSSDVPTAVLQSPTVHDDDDHDTSDTGSDDDDTDSSSVASSDDEQVADLQRQEDLALALIRGN